MQKTILTVDDSRSVRLTIALSLKQAGYRVLEAAGGDEALELLKTEHVDLILCDLNMPNMDGIELTRRICAQQVDRKTPVIMLTTDHQKGRLVEAKEAGAIGWMFKPFKSGDLVAAVRTVVDRVATP